MLVWICECRFPLLDQKGTEGLRKILLFHRQEAIDWPWQLSQTWHAFGICKRRVIYWPRHVLGMCSRNIYTECSFPSWISPCINVAINKTYSFFLFLSSLPFFISQFLHPHLPYFSLATFLFPVINRHDSYSSFISFFLKPSSSPFPHL